MTEHQEQTMKNDDEGNPLKRKQWGNKSPFERFSNALVLETAKKLGWSFYPDVEIPEFYFNDRILQGRQHLLVILNGDHLNPERLEKDLDRWFDLIEEKKIPQRLVYIVLLYVFQERCPDNIREMIPETRRMLSRPEISEKGVYTAYVDLSDNRIQIPREYFAEILIKPISGAKERLKSGGVLEDLNLALDGIDRKRHKMELFEQRLKNVKPWGTIVLLLCCIAMFLLVAMSGEGGLVLGKTRRLYPLLQFGANYGRLVRMGEWWRLVGSMFLHIGIEHLAINMIVLLFVGLPLERYMGTVKFMALYMFAGLVGAASSALLNIHLAAGASGAIFGLCGATAVIGFKYRNEIPRKLRYQLCAGMILYIIVAVISGFFTMGIDNAAHVGGLLAGCIFAFVVPPDVSEKRSWDRSLQAYAFFYLLAFVPLAVLFFVGYNGLTSPEMITSRMTEYKSPRGEFTIKHPDFFTVKRKKSISIFIGPGMIAQVMSFSTPEDSGLIEDADELVKQLEEHNVLTGEISYRVVNLGRRKWLIIKGLAPKKPPLQFQHPVIIAFTQSGDTGFRIHMGYSDKERKIAEELFERMLISFRATGQGTVVYGIDPKLKDKMGMAIANRQGPDKGIDYYDELIRKEQKNATAYRMRSLLHFQNKNYELALKDADKAVLLEPGNARGYEVRAMIYIGRNKTKEALKDLDSAIKLDPKEDSYYIMKAMIYSGLKEHEKTVENCTKAININPDDSKYYVYRAWSYSELGKPEKAVQDMTTVLDEKPDFSAMRLARGREYIKLNNYDKGIADFSEFIRKNPGYGKAYFLRALAFNSIGKHRSAMRDIKKAMEVSSGSFLPYLGLGFIQLGEGEFEKSVESLTKALNMNPGNHLIHAYRARAYTRLGERKKALADCKKAVELKPDDIQGYASYAFAYLDFNKLDKALKYANKAIKIDPKSPQAYCVRGDVYRAKGKYRKSISDADRALEINPHYQISYQVRGFSYMYFEKYKKALKDLKKAEDIHPRSYLTHSILGEYYFCTGEYQKSIEHFKRTRKLSTNVELELFTVLMDFISRSRLGRDGKRKLAVYMKSVERREWPYPIAMLYLGKTTPQKCIEAAKKDRPGLKQGRLCMTYFYLGEWYLAKDNRKKAVEYLQKCRAMKYPAVTEYHTAKVELERLQGE